MLRPYLKIWDWDLIFGRLFPLWASVVRGCALYCYEQNALWLFEGLCYLSPQQFSKSIYKGWNALFIQARKEKKVKMNVVSPFCLSQCLDLTSIRKNE